MSDQAMIAAGVALAGGFLGLSRAASTDEAAVAGLLRVPPVPDRPTRFRLDARASLLALATAAIIFGAVAAGPGGGIAGLGVVLGTRAALRRRARRQEADRLEEDLADAVTAIAAAMRAGLSLPQSIGYAAGEVEDPLARTLLRLVDRSTMGEPLQDCLDRWSRDVGSDDARLVVGVLSLHRRTGGDLPRVLDRLAATLRDRRAAMREVRALTAQARLSGGILGALPLAFFLFLAVTSRQDVRAAFDTAPGLIAVTMGLVMEGAAFLWIRRLLRVT